MNNIIFLISQPRSGSTLLQHVLSQNRFVGTTSEPWLLLPHLKHIRSVFQPEYTEASAINDFIKKNSTENYIKHYRLFLSSFYEEYLKEEEIYFLDKTPRYYSYIPEVRILFPSAKVILLHRNPISTLLSMIERWPRKSILDYYHMFDDIITAPMKMQENSRKDEHTFQLQYEEFIENPRDMSEEVYNFLNIEWGEQVLNLDHTNKIRGNLGDKKIFSTNKIAAKLPQRAINELKKNNLLQFARGYAKFLVDNEYSLYDLTFVDPKRTKEFDNFLAFYAFKRSLTNGFSLKNMLNAAKFSFYFHCRTQINCW